MSATTPIDVDLYSDTVTRPTPEMRRFMCDAEVGDEQKGEDPTVNRLQEMVAELLGKEAAVFLPSGTMCNEIALRVHCRPGDEMLAHRTAHPIHFETGGPAALAGVNVRPLDGAARAVRRRPRSRRASARTAATSRAAGSLWVEQTSNLGGGSHLAARARSTRGRRDVARRHGLATHMDGARLMNAVVASGVSARDVRRRRSTRPGSTSPRGWARRSARRWPARATSSPRPGGCKQQMGGAMRQAGIIAAGGVYALRHHVERLAEDHANARRLAEGLAELPGVDARSRRRSRRTSSSST